MSFIIFMLDAKCSDQRNSGQWWQICLFYPWPLWLSYFVYYGCVHRKEDKLRASPTRHRSSVHFFSKKIDSQPMTLPMSQSVSSGMSLSYYLSSKVTLSTGPPLTSKSTVMSSSQTDNMLGKQNTDQTLVFKDIKAWLLWVEWWFFVNWLLACSAVTQD